jgi:hypothetical protein
MWPLDSVTLAPFGGVISGGGSGLDRQRAGNTRFTTACRSHRGSAETAK